MAGSSLEGIQRSRGPPSLHFDMASSGHAAVTLPTLGKPFPPATHGYTFLAWIAITTPPSENETITLFGCSDEGNRCFLELALSADAELTIATSANRSPIAFENFTFDAGRWYHVAVVHQRPKYSTSSPVSLYINGRLVDAVKAPFPSTPAKDGPVSAWLGTPRERVTFNRLGKGKSAIQWDLGPAWLIHGDLPEDVIFLLHLLGPRYVANFQDRLGQYQTCTTAALINARLEHSHRDVNESSYRRSALGYAVKEKGSAVIQEHKIYFAFNALNAHSSHDVEHADEPVKTERLIINSAIADPHDDPSRFGVLSGALSVVRRHGVDIAIWKTGGVPVILRLIDAATTSEQLRNTLCLFVEYGRQSWRNTEDCERSQAYELLAYLLKGKASLITSDIHNLLFELVGFDHTDNTRSVIANTSAMRFIMLDFSLWSDADLDLRRAHFLRIQEMLTTSEFAASNARKLSKMRTATATYDARY